MFFDSIFVVSLICLFNFLFLLLIIIRFIITLRSAGPRNGVLHEHLHDMGRAVCG